jgi:hypothetical protein
LLILGKGQKRFNTWDNLRNNFLRNDSLADSVVIFDPTQAFPKDIQAKLNQASDKIKNIKRQKIENGTILQALYDFAVAALETNMQSNKLRGL